MSEQVEKALRGLVELREKWLVSSARWSRSKEYQAVERPVSEIASANVEKCASDLDAEITLHRTRLEKVLEAGQAMSDAIVGGYTDEWDQASDRWDAALAELAGKG